MENTIQKLMDEVETYKQAIRDAQDALDSAEKELDEELATRFEEKNASYLTVVK